jgi:hypothetical protein
MAYTSSQVVQAVPTGINSALVRIGGGTLSGTSTVFTSVFSATYNNYLVTFNSVAVDSSTPYLRIKIAGTSIHNFCVWESRSQGTTDPTTASAAETSAGISLAILDTAANVSTSGHITICSPFLTQRTGVDGSFMAAQNTYRFFTANGTVVSTASYTDFTIDNSSGQTFTAGTVNIYGYTLS